MRKIAFRAWDKEKKKMYYVPAWYFSLSVVGLGMGTEAHELGTDHCEVMQFTGLKDKDGKECFVGDIIEAEWKGKKEYVEIYADTMIPRERGVKCGKKWDNFVMPSDIQINKIAGNIYENPELIK